VMADLLYWPASMIADSTDMFYRDAGDVLPRSAVKGANPRNDTNSGGASGGPRKAYGYRSGRSPVSAQIGCGANVSADRWRGEYYTNATLTGSPAMVRDDGDGFLNLNFGGGSPGLPCGVNADSFSARWTRTVNFAQDIYRFSVTGDDGVRLYVDG